MTFRTLIASTALAAGGMSIAFLGCSSETDNAASSTATTDTTSSAGGGGVGGGSSSSAGGNGGSVSYAAGTPHYENGTRLEARVLDGGDGAEQFTSWFDTTLGIECQFATAEDDVVRCSPVSNTTIGFSDAACTQPVAFDDCNPSLEGGYARRIVEVGDSCGTPFKWAFYKVGAAITKPATIYEPDGDGCVVSGFDPTTVHSATKEDATEYVAAQTEMEQLSATLGAEVWVGEDGSRQVRSYWDVVGNHACSASGNDCPAEYGVAYAIAPLTYGDAGCTEIAGRGVCDDPAVIYTSDTVNCTTTVTYREVGNELTTLYSGTPGSCSEKTGETQTYYELGDEASVLQIDDFTLGSGRLQVQATSANGTVASIGAKVRGQFWDTTLIAGCSPRTWQGRTGQLCVPQAADIETSPSTLFSDAACTQPVWASYTDPSLPCLATTRYGEVREDVACGEADILRLVELGAEHTGNIYDNSSGSCLGPAAKELGRFYMEATDVAASSLAPVTSK